MFGLPAFFVVGRLFACVSETGVALRIPLEMAQTFVGADHLRPFAPFGRAPMRGWLHRAVGLEADTSRERALLIATCDYVRTLR